MAHKASQIFEDSLFDGDVNAIVDFKYFQQSEAQLVVRSSSERVSDAGGRQAFFGSNTARRSLRHNI